MLQVTIGVLDLLQQLQTFHDQFQVNIKRSLPLLCLSLQLIILDKFQNIHKMFTHRVTKLRIFLSYFQVSIPAFQ